MITVADLLKIKGNQVWTIAPGTTLLEALRLMAEKNVGALLVVANDKIVGIISERDFARSIAKTGRCLVDSAVNDYMTTDVVTVQVSQSIEDVMMLMNRGKFRHLPVLDGEKLVGIVSIGDVVKQIIASKDTFIESLENYIENRGYGH